MRPITRKLFLLDEVTSDEIIECLESNGVTDEIVNTYITNTWHIRAILLFLVSEVKDIREESRKLDPDFVHCAFYIYENMIRGLSIHGLDVYSNIFEFYSYVNADLLPKNTFFDDTLYRYKDKTKRLFGEEFTLNNFIKNLSVHGSMCLKDNLP
jgi:hypothetical protein